MSFDDPKLANEPYNNTDVDEIERVRGKPYPRLRATVEALRISKQARETGDRALEAGLNIQATLRRRITELQRELRDVREELALSQARR